MDNTLIIQLVVSGLLGGGFLAAIVALLKVRPEASESNVNAAGKANEILPRVLQDLENRYNALDERYEHLEKEYNNLHLEFKAVKAERDQFQSELTILRNKLNSTEGVSAS